RCYTSAWQSHLDNQNERNVILLSWMHPRPTLFRARSTCSFSKHLASNPCMVSGLRAGLSRFLAAFSKSTRVRFSQHFSDWRAGWIDSEWRDTDNSRRAKFYALTRAGRKQLEVETTDWMRRAGAVARLLKDEG